MFVKERVSQLSNDLMLLKKDNEVGEGGEEGNRFLKVSLTSDTLCSVRSRDLETIGLTRLNDLIVLQTLLRSL